MNIGPFATGEWLDSRYDCVWELKADGIRLLNKTTGKEIWNFRNHNVINVKVEPQTTGVILKFEITDWNWKYELTKGLTDANISAKITNEEGKVFTFPLAFQNIKIGQ
jgi:hypothetical protein